MEGFANLVSMLDYAVNTRRKRHITGGLLISAALLFGGLAITVMSTKDEEEETWHSAGLSRRRRTGGRFRMVCRQDAVRRAFRAGD